MTQQCLFCDSDDLNQEHIWPDWLVEEFKARGPSGRGAYTATWDHSDGFSKEWPQGTITMKRRLVCKECNGHWMSDIESIASPILKPLLFDTMAPKQMTVYDQMVIGMWTILRAMIIDATAPPKKQYFRLSDRLAFVTADRPPPTSRIWIAPCDGPAFGAWFRSRGLRSSTKKLGIDSVTFIIHKIAIQVLSWEGERAKLREGKLRAEWGAACLEIWPTDKSRSWPPTTYINRSLIDTFMKRFDVRIPDRLL
jgi:hypothetical protein